MKQDIKDTLVHHATEEKTAMLRNRFRLLEEIEHLPGTRLVMLKNGTPPKSSLS